MKFIIDQDMAHDVQELQKVYQVTLISDKGLVFMHKDDWQRICQLIDEYSDIIAQSKKQNTLTEWYTLCSECFIVAYDESEDFSCYAVVNFELFATCCRRCNIWLVLMPMWNLISYVRQFNAHLNNDALGCYIKSRGDVLIDVEDN